MSSEKTRSLLIAPEELEEILDLWKQRLEQFKQIKALSDESKENGYPFVLHSQVLSKVLGIKEKDLANLRNTEDGVPYYRPGGKSCYYEFEEALQRLSHYKFSSIKEEKASRHQKQNETVSPEQSQQ